MRTLLLATLLVPASLIAMPAEAQQVRGRPSAMNGGSFRAPAMRPPNISRPAGTSFPRPGAVPRAPGGSRPQWNQGGGGRPGWNNGGNRPPRWNHGGGRPPQWNNGGNRPPQWNHGGGKPPQWNNGGGHGPRPRPPGGHPGRWGNKINGKWHGGWNAPGGWGGYRHQQRGWRLPSYWMGSGFLIGDYFNYGLIAPPSGYFWTRYYDDAVLVDSYGQVRDSVSGIQWDGDGYYEDGGYAGDGYYADDYYDESAGYPGGYAPPVAAPPPAVQAPACVQGCGGSYSYQGGGYAWGNGYVSGGYYYPGPTTTTVVIQQAAPVVTTTVTEEIVEDVVTTHYAAPRRVVRRAAAPTKLRKRCAC